MMLQTEVFRLDPDVTVISCSGRFTMGNRLKETETLCDTLIAEGVRKMVLDLTYVDVVDSAGLGVIMHVSGSLEQHGGLLRLCGLGERVRHLLAITHTDTLLAIDDHVDVSVSELHGRAQSA
jgi:anti-sigma B factor antagonist